MTFKAGKTLSLFTMLLLGVFSSASAAAQTSAHSVSTKEFVARCSSPHGTVAYGFCVGYFAATANDLEWAGMYKNSEGVPTCPVGIRINDSATAEELAAKFVAWTKRPGFPDFEYFPGEVNDFLREIYPHSLGSKLP